MFIEILCIIAIVLCLIALINIRYVPNNNAWVIERRGKFNRVIGRGIHIVIPIIEKVVKKIDLSNQRTEFFYNDIKTKDSQFIEFKVNCTYNIYNPQLYTYGRSMKELVSLSIKKIIDNYNCLDLKNKREQFVDDTFYIINDSSSSIGVKIRNLNIYYE